MTALIVDRLQFAFTIMFHYLFPITTMGLAPFVAWYTVRAARTGDPELGRAAAFWTNIFAVNFAIGVVTGIPMEFQFGTNWAAFSAKAGSVIGQPLAMEGVFAFFFESIFLGALLYARKAVPSRLQGTGAVCVWLGSWLSGFFIVATDAWMQHPVGYAIATGGRIEMTSLWDVLMSPFAWWQYLHVLCGALVAGGLVVAGIGAYYLLSKREEVLARDFVRRGVAVAAIFAALAVFPTGDRNSANVTEYQPVKLAAMEGLFQSKVDAPLAIIGMPDVANRKLIDPVVVPDVLSFLAYGNMRAGVHGLTAYATALWPPVELTYYAYHVMVGLGTIFVGLLMLACALLWRERLFKVPAMLWALMLAMPFPYIANEAGWMTTEVGRQPWIVYGLMRTSEALSPNVVTGESVFTLIGFLGMYFLLGVLFLYLTLREIASGPSGVHP
ncbi:MAG TPA: cytochrome ubiquinol oxidase subunit I [Candidatus Baltobacteraceae bacterium]|nr:cytochrome ubiquinol oxidase subunit I [Candidatus Baltobacteraceae bacterium]